MSAAAARPSVPVTVRRSNRGVAGAPRHPDLHLLRSPRGGHAFIPDGSRLYDLDAALHAELDRLLSGGARSRPALDDALRSLGMSTLGFVSPDPPAPPPVRYLSLAVAQTCNLGCAYCYADGGDFGGDARPMTWEIGWAAVRTLLDGTPQGGRAGVSFLGGEPLANRRLVHGLTRAAAQEAARRSIDLRFSITTNGTLVERRDVDLFDEHAFAVSVSIDGIGEAHDRLRRFRDGSGTYARVLERVAPLLERKGGHQVSARVTVTADNLDLPSTLDGLVGMGFHSVGFAPVLSSPSRALELATDDVPAVLEAMTDCGRTFLDHTIAGRRYPFSNMTTALQAIHRGAHRPYPCGAGAAYLGVAADGAVAACHRFVGDERAAMGDVRTGFDHGARSRWLATRHVDHQQPCRSCWARYLCGGGCHHEVLNRGRPACDLVRGWLEFCLSAYVTLSEARPDWFGTGQAQR